MPIFQPRTRVQILREMAARVVARSKLAGLEENSVVFHILAAAANEDAEQYVQMARLRSLFSLDDAKGSDLDERAAEIVPGTVFRRKALTATTQVQFSRPGIVGTIAIPVGTQVAAQDANGQIRFRTTAAGSILNGNSTSGLIDVVATEAGSRANVAANTIVKLVSRIAGVTGVTNPAAVSNGFDRESDENFVARVRAFVQSISRGTPTAIEGFAKQVILTDGRRVVFARVDEPAIPNGKASVYIDDGTGSIETFDSQYIGSPDAVLPSALGGEKNLYTTERPIRDDGSFELSINSVVQTRGVDYELNPSIGQIELSAASFPTGLTALDNVEAEYRFYTGLVKETQRVISGDPANRLSYPGVQPAGIQVQVLPAEAVYQTLSASIVVSSGFDPAVIANNVKTAIQNYINTLNIGAPVIVSEIIERAMSTTGMYNFTLLDLNGGTPADQVILANQVARILSAGITLT